LKSAYQALEKGSNVPLDSENLSEALTDKAQKGSTGTFKNVPLIGKKGVATPIRALVRPARRAML